ncbi:hypothetical protein AHAS_Ahas18G0275200 [Arachis hypogaea]
MSTAKKGKAKPFSSKFKFQNPNQTLTSSTVPPPAVVVVGASAASSFPCPKPRLCFSSARRPSIRLAARRGPRPALR